LCNVELSYDLAVTLRFVGFGFVLVRQLRSVVSGSGTFRHGGLGALRYVQFGCVAADVDCFVLLS